MLQWGRRVDFSINAVVGRLSRLRGAAGGSGGASGQAGEVSAMREGVSVDGGGGRGFGDRR
jgi:hypothetical protein